MFNYFNQTFLIKKREKLVFKGDFTIFAVP